VRPVKLGIFAFPTDLSMGIVPLAREVEERGFHSIWVPDHSHIPSNRRTPPGGRRSDRMDLPDEYRRNLDCFGALCAAAAVTSEIVLGTGVCLIAQRHPIWLAKEVATVDLLSDGRFVLGAGFGWNREEMAQHGVDFATRRARGREHVKVMQALWSEEEASFEGEYFTMEPSWQWPKPVQRPHPPIWLGGANVADLFDQIVEYASGWMPTALDSVDLPADLAALAARCEAAGRDPAEITLGCYAPRPDVAELERLEALGFDWVALAVRPAPVRDERETLDRYAPLLDRFGAR
jgi:probable F420-dependent oxidoreductase